MNISVNKDKSYFPESFVTAVKIMILKFYSYTTKAAVKLQQDSCGRSLHD